MGLGTLQRKLSPFSRMVIDYAGLLYVLFMGIILVYMTSYLACPNMHDVEYCETMDLWIWFIVFEAAVNLACFHYFSKDNCVTYWQRVSCVADLCRHSDEVEDYVRYGTDDPLCITPDAKYCVDCNRRAPIRSHHCPMCGICVLRKDHHCFITGGCVGLGNQRYFVVFVFWTTIGCALATYVIAQYLDVIITPWYPFGWVHYLAPVALVKWILAKELFANVLVCVGFSFGVACFIASLAFFSIQVFYTCHGYTMYEYHSLGIREEFDGDGKNFGERFRLVFGPYWAVNFIFPAVWWPQKLTSEIANNLFRVRSKLL